MKRENIREKIDYLDSCSKELSTRSHTKLIILILRMILDELEKE